MGNRWFGNNRHWSRRSWRPSTPRAGCRHDDQHPELKPLGGADDEIVRRFGHDSRGRFGVREYAFICGMMLECVRRVSAIAFGIGTHRPTQL